MDMDALRRQLIRHEGLRLRPYKDSVGKLTIGVGRNLDDRGITEEEAAHLLDNDIAVAVADLDREFKWWRGLDSVRQRVLVDMCFNLGISRLLGFQKMLAALEAGDYHTAALEMLSSRWADQVRRRADTLALMVETGEDPF